MSPKLIDDQRLIIREQQIIDAGIGLIQQQGIENLTMDKVVAKVPFSKGTVYKHFLGKEDLLLSISNQAITILGDLFWRASLYNGCPRERMQLLNMSCLIYAILHPALFKAVICAKSPNIYCKSSEQGLQQQEQLEAKLMGAIFGIVEQGIASHALTLPANMDMQQVCFANWSMGYGTIALLSNEVEQCSSSSGLIVERELFNQNNLLFDGLQWAPLTHERDYGAALRVALQQVFPDELALMKTMGRELNF